MPRRAVPGCVTGGGPLVMISFAMILLSFLSCGHCLYISSVDTDSHVQSSRVCCHITKNHIPSAAQI